MRTVNIPPQSAPAIDVDPKSGDMRVNKTWWLALHATATAASGAGLDGYYQVPVILTGALYSATPDLAKGLKQEVDLNQPLIAIVAPANTALAMTWTLVLEQDAAGGRAVTFDAAGYAGAAALVGMLDTTGGTYCALTFVVRPDGLSALHAITTGLPAL